MSGEEIETAAALLRAGQLVAFPTETVYGLGANALDSDAVDLIFKAKGRPSDNPLIVHVPHLDAARCFLATPIDSVSERLAARFWPGPLTIVFQRNEDLSKKVLATNVSGGLNTVGIRVPAHPVALRLLLAAGVPLAAPSANKSGSPSPTTAAHVANDHEGSGLMIIDGGACEVGLESTVVQVVEGKVVILRPGGVSSEQLKDAGFDMGILNTTCVTDAPRAPGMKYRHYAPKARVVPIFSFPIPQIEKPDLLIVFDSNNVDITCGKIISFGLNPRDIQTASAKLFDLLRHADLVEAQNVFVDCTFDRETGLGVALWNRIAKAHEG